MPDLNSDDKNRSIAGTVYFTDDNTVKTGTVIKTDSFELDSEFGAVLEPDTGITLDDLHTFYVNHENSGEQTYRYLVNYLKDNPENINNTVSSILTELGSKYDSTNVKHGNVGADNGEYLETVFSTGKGEETAALICGTIHNFLRDALNDAGIEAVTVVGASNSNKNGFTNHATLLYKNSDGTYQFNNYGQSATIKANSLKNAVYTVHKETGLLESGGQIELHDKNGSYHEYALSESAAYGNTIDKRSDNASTPFDNTVESNSRLDIKIGSSTSGNTAVTAEKVFAGTDLSHTVGVQYKKSGENSEFYNSSSLGVRYNLAKENISINPDNGSTTLNYDIGGVYSHTTGQPGGDAGKISYETFKFKGRVGVESSLHNTGNTEVKNCANVSLQGYGVVGHSNHYSSSYDARLTVEDGISITKKSENQTFTGNISGGAVVDAQRDVNSLKPAPGAKLNIGAGYSISLNDNLTVSVNTSAHGVFTGNTKDTGFQASAGTIWSNPNKSSNITGCYAAAGINTEHQTLDIGGFKQKENTLALRIAAGMEAGNVNMGVYYEQNNYSLNPLKNTKTYGVSARFTF